MDEIFGGIIKKLTEKLDDKNFTPKDIVKLAEVLADFGRTSAMYNSVTAAVESADGNAKDLKKEIKKLNRKPWEGKDDDED